MNILERLRDIAGMNLRSGGLPAHTIDTAAEAINEITRLRALIAEIKAALGTEEDGAALVEVAYNAHRAEQEAAAKGRRDEP